MNPATCTNVVRDKNGTLRVQFGKTELEFSGVQEASHWATTTLEPCRRRDLQMALLINDWLIANPQGDDASVIVSKSSLLDLDKATQITNLAGLIKGTP